ncbi:serpin family protein [Kamptonema cortianum]|nr:serpin family protein [Geitlerinema splendidum]MDK3158325.1 serpin family protein [Kamptonema cortianum]
MVRQTLQFSLIITTLLALTSCSGRETTNFLATDKYPFKGREAGAEEVAAFQSTATTFSFRAAEALLEDGGVIGSAALFQFGLVLLNGAEGETYNDAARLLGTQEADSFPYDYAFCDWIGRFGNGSPLSVRGSLWMLWPVPVEESFRKDMAEHFRFDVQKIGSVGISARRYVDEWWLAETGRSEAAPVNLDKANVMVALSSQSVSLCPWETAPTGERAKGDFLGRSDKQQVTFWRAKVRSLAIRNTRAYKLRTTSGLSVYFLPLQDAISPTLEDWSSLIEQAGKEENLWIPEIRLETRSDLPKLMNSLGAGGLLQPPLDLPSLSVELSGNYTVGPGTHFARLSISGHGISSVAADLGDEVQALTPDMGNRLDQPFTIIVIDDTWRIPAFIGRIVQF